MTAGRKAGELFLPALPGGRTGPEEEEEATADETHASPLLLAHLVDRRYRRGVIRQANIIFSHFCIICPY